MRILDPHRKPAGRASAATLAAIVGVGMFVLPTAQVATAQEPGPREIHRLRRQLDRLQHQSDRLRHRLDALEHRAQTSPHETTHDNVQRHEVHAGRAGPGESDESRQLHALHNQFVQQVEKAHDIFVEQHREHGQHGDLEQNFFQHLQNLHGARTDKTGNAALHDIFVQHLRNNGHGDLLSNQRLPDDAPDAGHTPHPEHGTGHGDQPHAGSPGHADPGHRAPSHDLLFVEQRQGGQPEHGKRRRAIRL